MLILSLSRIPRGQANEWYEAISVLVRQSINLRRWFVIEELLGRPQRIVEYLLECPISEVCTENEACDHIIVLLKK